AAAGYRIFAHPGVHPRYRRRRAIHRGSDSKIEPFAVSQPRCLSASDYHQLRSAWHPVAECLAQIQLRASDTVWLRLVGGIYAGPDYFRGHARAHGAGQYSSDVSRRADRGNYRGIVVADIHGFQRIGDDLTGRFTNLTGQISM